jgi:hypothetical protein
MLMESKRVHSQGSPDILPLLNTVFHRTPSGLISCMFESNFDESLLTVAGSRHETKLHMYIAEIFALMLVNYVSAPIVRNRTLWLRRTLLKYRRNMHRRCTAARELPTLLQPSPMGLWVVHLQRHAHSRRLVCSWPATGERDVRAHTHIIGTRIFMVTMKLKVFWLSAVHAQMLSPIESYPTRLR